MLLFINYKLQNWKSFLANFSDLAPSTIPTPVRLNDQLKRTQPFKACDDYKEHTTICTHYFGQFLFNFYYKDGGVKELYNSILH